MTRTLDRWLRDFVQGHRQRRPRVGILLRTMEREAAGDDVDALRTAGGDRDVVLGRLLQAHRRRLLKMVDLRMDPHLRARVSPSDVVQETFVEVSTRVGTYLEDPRMPFFLWLRFLAAQKLVAMYRHHAGAQKRDVRRQVSLERRRYPDASSVMMARELAASLTSPSGNAMRDELRAEIEGALDRMGDADREILVLRHFEELSNAEAAAELGIRESASSKRYLRALQRLRSVLSAVAEDER